MHNAPSVRYPVGHSRFAAGLMLALVVSGAVVTAAWLLQAGRPDWQHALAISSVFLCGALAWSNVAGAQHGTLSWTGQAWRWSSGAASCEGMLAAHLDLQSVMLLRFKAPDSQALWVWVDRRAYPQSWVALRRAVYSRVRAPRPGRTGSVDAGAQA